MRSASNAVGALRAGSARPTRGACGSRSSLILRTSKGGYHLRMHLAVSLIEQSYGKHRTAATPSCSSTSSRASIRSVLLKSSWADPHDGRTLTCSARRSATAPLKSNGCAILKAWRSGDEMVRSSRGRLRLAREQWLRQLRNWRRPLQLPRFGVRRLPKHDARGLGDLRRPCCGRTRCRRVGPERSRSSSTAMGAHALVSSAGPRPGSSRDVLVQQPELQLSRG